MVTHSRDLGEGKLRLRIHLFGGRSEDEIYSVTPAQLDVGLKRSWIPRVVLVRTKLQWIYKNGDHNQPAFPPRRLHELLVAGVQGAHCRNQTDRFVRLTYCLANGGIGPSERPRTSLMTRTWPSHCVPAPIPIVGIFRLAVTRPDRPAGMDSRTMANAPALSSNSASLTSFSAASESRPCGRKPPSWWTDCGVRPRCPMTGTPISTSRFAVSTICRPPSIFTAAAPPS